MDILLVVMLSYVLIAIFCAFCVHIAYRHGVRDGYQNDYLPHVRNQIREEKLEQWIAPNWIDE